MNQSNSSSSAANQSVQFGSGTVINKKEPTTAAVKADLSVSRNKE